MESFFKEFMPTENRQGEWAPWLNIIIIIIIIIIKYMFSSNVNWLTFKLSKNCKISFLLKTVFFQTTFRVGLCWTAFWMLNTWSNILLIKRSYSSLLIFAVTVDFAEYFPLPLNAS